MRAFFRHPFPWLVLALGSWAAGCGSRTDLPLAPTPSVRGAAIQGTVLTGASASSSSAQAFSADGGRIRVSVAGTSLSTTTDSSGRFRLDGVRPGRVRLHFEGPAIDAHLEIPDVGEGRVLTITVRVSGSEATLVSSHDDSDDDPDDDQEAELKGTIESITPPSLTVSGRTVITDANTRIKRDDQTIALTDLKVGEKVEVEGTRQPDGSVLAKKIKVEDQDEDDDDQEAELEGTIESITPPSLTVSGRTVITDANTRIKRDDQTIALTDLKVGEKVEVEGTRQPDGSVLAEKIKVEDEDD